MGRKSITNPLLDVPGAFDPMNLVNPFSFAAAGGASAFGFIRSASNSSNGAVASVTMASDITAGRLLCVFFKWEGSGNPTTIVENGGGTFTNGVEPTPQAGGDLRCRMHWLLSATGGGTVININYTGTCTFTRVIAMEFSYGGTATHVVAGENSSGSSTTPTSDSVTNSGTHRLNIAGVGNYLGAAFTTPLIGGVAGDWEPNTQVSDTWAFFNNEALASETGNCTYATGADWVLSFNCFAAN